MYDLHCIGGLSVVDGLDHSDCYLQNDRRSQDSKDRQNFLQGQRLDFLCREYSQGII
jgi:hypothetical protein